MQRSLPRRSLAVLALACLAATLTLVAGPGRAATPTGGTVSPAQPIVNWSGGPFLALNPALTTGCVVKEAPFCDFFDLEVGHLDPDQPDVVVSITGDSGTDVFYLTVYDSSGNELVHSSNIANSLQVVLDDPAPGTYSVRVELLLGTPTASTYRGTAAIGDRGAVDPEVPCGPADLPIEDPAVLLTPDDGRQVFLDVLVVLDGVEEGFAREFFADVAVPYEEINVTVRPTFVAAGTPFNKIEAPDLMNELKDRFGGKVPAEYDIVELLTAKDITLVGQSGVAGMADCIGGLAYDSHSFEVSEAYPTGYEDPAGIRFGPFTLAARVAAKITSHEMGHLLGGQHHYANCVEGISLAEEGGELSGDTSPCSLMFNFADLVSLDFGAVNARIARGYAVTYAAANDNRAPDAVDDSAATRRNRSTVIDVLTNDSDPDGDTLTLDSVSTPSAGTARLVDGRVEYTPRKGFGGADTFSYTVSDGQGHTDTAVVTVSVGLA